MGFVIGAVVALVVIFLLSYITVKKPVFGEVMIALSLLMIVTALFFYFQQDEREENRKHLIPLEQIELSDFSHSLAYGNNYKLTAQLKNKSQRYRLQSINLKILFYQCPASFKSTTDKQFENCRLVIEKEHSIKTRLAPQQSSHIESYILLDDDVLSEADGSLMGADGSLLKADGSLQWQIQIVNGIAR